jgi:hypothetical protein
MSESGRSNGRLSAWFKKEGVKPGEWYGEVKSFMRLAARAGFTVEGAAVLFALRLYTVAYKSQKAIKQVKGEEGKKKFISVTPNDLSKDTGYDRQKVRDALAEIEVKGFGARKAADDGALRKGKVEIYCWTVPRPPKIKPDPGPIVPRSGYKIIQRIKAAAAICDLRLPKGFVPSQEYKVAVEKALLEYKEATKVPQERLKEALFVAPGAPAYKEERNPLKEEAERVSAAAGGVENSENPPQPQEPPPPPRPTPPQDASENPEQTLLAWMREWLKNYPGAKHLAGVPDDPICQRCLTAGTPEEIAAALRAMHKAGKAPSKSWAWFTPEIIRQHIPEKERKADVVPTGN